MSKQTDLIALIREYQNLNHKTEIYFSLSTCLQMLCKQEVQNIFTLTTGDVIELPEGIFNKHIDIDISEFVSFQPFVLDTVLISARNLEIYDKFNALDSINKKTILTTRDPHNLFNEKPFLSIRAASLISETGYTPDKDIVESIRNSANKLKHTSGKVIWKELQRLLKTQYPSIGIEFLRNTGVLQIILPELYECLGVDQNIKYHKYTVYEHCLKACDCCENNDIRLRFAALIHDIGKPPTRAMGINGATFHKHEVAGSKMSQTIVSRFNINEEDALFIIGLVSNHMYQYHRDWKDTTVKKFIRKTGITKEYLGRLEEFPLFKLRHADRRGRDLNPITQKQTDFENRIEIILKAI